jgi:hypothetical protein
MTIDEIRQIGASVICKRWWKKNRISLILRWVRMGFGYKERKFLQKGLSDINPYYHPGGIGLSTEVCHEYQRRWLNRSSEHPDLVYWMS